MATDPFVGEIFMFAGNFAMRGTAMCNGQILPISQNTALFSLLGTYYGGNGTSNFALPDLMGKVPVGQGILASVSPYDLGQTAGSSSITLLQSEMPIHNHPGPLSAAINVGGTPLISDPVGGYPATAASAKLYGSTTGANFMTPLNSNLNANTDIAGQDQPHENMQPYLAVTFVVALQGVFPARN